MQNRLKSHEMKWNPGPMMRPSPRPSKKDNKTKHESHQPIPNSSPPPLSQEGRLFCIPSTKSTYSPPPSLPSLSLLYSILPSKETQSNPFFQPKTNKQTNKKTKERMSEETYQSHSLHLHQIHPHRSTHFPSSSSSNPPLPIHIPTNSIRSNSSSSSGSSVIIRNNILESAK